MIRPAGTVYTPASLADTVVMRALQPLPGALRICDPACGEGALLQAAKRFLVARRGMQPADAEACLTGVDRDARALAAARAALPGARFIEADALRHSWRGEVFDAVVGNPPWVSYSGRHAVALPTDERRFLADRFATFAGWPSLHGPFVELAVRLCRPGGRVALLLPAQVCDLERYAPLRAFVRARCEIEAPLDCGEDAFAGITQPCCALIGARRGAPVLGTESAWRMDAAPKVDNERYARLARPAPEMFGDIGVHTGNCARKLVRDRGGVPLREGKDVTAFRLAPARRGLRDDYVAAEGEYFRFGPLARFQAVPIVLRQTATHPIAALHTAPSYFRNSVLACRGVPGVPPELVVAWLNATAIADYHRARVREAHQRSFPQLKLKHLRALPMPLWDAPPRGLPALAKLVAVDGRLDLAPDLDALVEIWLNSAS